MHASSLNPGASKRTSLPCLHTSRFALPAARCPHHHHHRSASVVAVGVLGKKVWRCSPLPTLMWSREETAYPCLRSAVLTAAYQRYVPQNRYCSPPPFLLPPPPDTSSCISLPATRRRHRCRVAGVGWDGSLDDLRSLPCPSPSSVCLLVRHGDEIPAWGASIDP